MANLFMRFPNGLSRCLTLSYDDGVIQDERMIELMKKRGLRGTFNLNSGCYADRDYDDYHTTHRRLTKERAIKLYTGSGFEVASHAVTHPFLEQLSPAMCNYEILQDKLNLEKDYDSLVRGFAYPFGTYNDDVVAALKASGIVYARTVWSSHSFDIPSDWLRLRPTCHHADPELGALTDRFLEEDRWGGAKFFYLWGHTYEFDFADNWSIIENFAEKVGNRNDIWYATNIEAYDYINAYKQLLFDGAMTKAVNPTAFTLWFRYDDKTYSVEPGKSINIG